MSAFLFGVPGKLKTLLDRLTSTRAGYLDNLDATISSRAPSSTALSSSTWTGTKAGYLDAAISGRLGSIKQCIYRAPTTATWVSASATITDTFGVTVDTAKTIVLPLGATISGTTIPAMQIRYTLTSSTQATIVAKCQGITSDTLTAQYLLIEFN